MAYVSNLGAVERALIRGADAGLTAAAENYTTKVRARLDRGYTTGNFSHHARGVAGRVMYTKPYDVPGGRAVTMGTSTTAVPYELYWELGHVNIFVGAGSNAGSGPRATSLGSRRQGTYVRVEIWRPIFEQNRDLMIRIVARNMERELAGSGATAVVAFTMRTGR